MHAYDSVSLEIWKTKKYGHLTLVLVGKPMKGSH